MRRKSKKIIKITSVLLSLSLIGSLVPPQHALAAEKQTAQEAQQEQEQEYERIEISSADELVQLAAKCHASSWSQNKYVVLTKDIDISQADFDNIASFNGIFDGQGHTITGYQYHGEGYVAGLFRYIGETGLVENLTLKGSVSAENEKQRIGGIVGMNRGIIRNCTFQGSVSGKSETGGIAGINDASGVIQKCSAKGRISGYYYTGGITGKNYGLLDNCTNYANVNDSGEWVEEDDEMSAELLLDIADNSQNIKLQSGVDTGGIVGFSRGTVLRCANKGIIGYEHTGYNIGGIAGRQSGVIAQCTNYATVYGRKDIGGIVGQMEPYIEYQETDSLKREINVLHDLIEKTLRDMDSSKDVISVDMDVLQAYADNAVGVSGYVSDTVSEYMDKNTDQINSVIERFETVLEMLSPVVHNAQAAGGGLTGFQDRLKDMTHDLNFSVHLSQEDKQKVQEALDNISAYTGTLQGKYNEISMKLNEITTLMKNEDGTIKSYQDLTKQEREELERLLTELTKSFETAGDAASTILEDLSSIAAIYGKEIVDSSKSANKNLSQAIEEMRQVSKYLNYSSNGISDILDYLNAQDDIRVAKLGSAFDDNVDALRDQLQGMIDTIGDISDHAASSSGVVNQDLIAVNRQLNKVFQIFLDKFEDYSSDDIGGRYQDVSEEEIEAAKQGRVDNSINKGVVRGDIDVGGIAGSMAIDEEDPEENAAGTSRKGLGGSYTTKCIIKGSANHGYVTSKKNGAGGIVGFMKYGVVTDCYGYGTVESTDGDYVGGISGESQALIRSSYALCAIAGSKNVGGIAGYGSVISDCYSMVNLQRADGRFGTIAGQTALEEEEGKISNNFYVSDTIYGIDNISFPGKAEPMTYEELLSVEGIPEEFRHLKVTYKVDDMYLGTQELAYGESLAKLRFPEAPKKEGSYCAWQDVSGEKMTGNLVIEGEYKENITVAQSGTKQEKALAYAEGTFTEEMVLNARVSEQAPPAEVTGDYTVYEISLENSGGSAKDTYQVRLLNPFEKAQVWTYRESAWQQLPSKIRGRYVQVEMNGTEGVFCIAEESAKHVWKYAALGAGVLVCLLLIRQAHKRIKKKRASKKKNKKEKQ